MTTIEYVQLICAAVLPMTILAVALNRYSSGRGIGVRVIQFTAASMVLPAIVILTTGGYIGGETSATVIGALIGYLFSNIGSFEEPLNRGASENSVSTGKSGKSE